MHEGNVFGRSLGGVEGLVFSRALEALCPIRVEVDRVGEDESGLWAEDAGAEELLYQAHRVLARPLVDGVGGTGEIVGEVDPPEPGLEFAREGADERRQHGELLLEK